MKFSLPFLTKSGKAAGGAAKPNIEIEAAAGPGSRGHRFSPSCQSGQDKIPATDCRCAAARHAGLVRLSVHVHHRYARPGAGEREDERTGGGAARYTARLVHCHRRTARQRSGDRRFADGRGCRGSAPAGGIARVSVSHGDEYPAASAGHRPGGYERLAAAELCRTRPDAGGRTQRIGPARRGSVVEYSPAARQHRAPRGESGR